METSITTSKGQVLIPKRLRDRYGIKPRKKVILQETDEGVLIKPFTNDHISKLRGILKGDGNLLEEMRQHKKEEQDIEDRKFALLFGKDAHKKGKIISSAELKKPARKS